MGWSRKKKDRLQHPCIPSAIQLVPYSCDTPILNPPKKYEIVKEELIRPGTSKDPDFKAEGLNEPNRLNKAELSDLARYLDFPKQKAELLASRLQQWNLHLPRVKITEYRTREKNLHFFEKKEHLIACIDVNSLMNFMNISCDLNK
ncbi:hypothetical protein TNCT_307261 [Trichonephila clavata]|uniref:Uncharacterized protein n=1 Tax=Trichonephila clavata TaxID=2740835 RepID=A0A8X6LQ05_TRICU|nr:hypothetical protein TNCT_307261 [Trichonephila clavata]